MNISRAAKITKLMAKNFIKTVGVLTIVSLVIGSLVVFPPGGVILIVISGIGVLNAGYLTHSQLKLEETNELTRPTTQSQIPNNQGVQLVKLFPQNNLKKPPDGHIEYTPVITTTNVPERSNPTNSIEDQSMSTYCFKR